MDLCLNNVNDEEIATLDKLFNLEPDLLYSFIGTCYEFLYGNTPNWMQSWSNQQLVEWFQTTYSYCPIDEKWKASITVH